MICCCTLVGTEACKNCNNNKTNQYVEYKTTYFTPEMYKIDYYKKDEKKKPILQYWCPDCDALLNKYDKFCHNCRLRLDWEDI